MTSPSPLQAALLALVQGITEFLPISSSAHLILASWALGWEDQGLAFDIATHVGSWLALVWCSRAELTAELTAWRQGRSRLLVPVVIGTIPVVVAGLLVHGWVATTGRGPLLIASTTIIFGLLLAVADRRAGPPQPNSSTPEIEQPLVVGWKIALFIGLAQAIALIPGTSRSGITITAALLAGLSRVEAARFSFLLAIPLGAAVGLKDAVDLATAAEPVNWGILALGAGVAALSAWVVIRLFLAWIQRHTMTPFVVYRLLLGVAILALLVVRG